MKRERKQNKTENQNGKKRMNERQKSCENIYERAAECEERANERKYTHTYSDIMSVPV